MKTSLSQNEKMLLALLKAKGMYDELLEQYGSDRVIIEKFMEHRIPLKAVLRMKTRHLN